MFKQITFVINLNIEPRSEVINFDFQGNDIFLKY